MLVESAVTVLAHIARSSSGSSPRLHVHLAAPTVKPGPSTAELALYRHTGRPPMYTRMRSLLRARKFDSSAGASAVAISGVIRSGSAVAAIRVTREDLSRRDPMVAPAGRAGRTLQVSDSKRDERLAVELVLPGADLGRRSDKRPC